MPSTSTLHRDYARNLTIERLLPSGRWGLLALLLVFGIGAAVTVGSIGRVLSWAAMAVAVGFLILTGLTQYLFDRRIRLLNRLEALDSAMSTEPTFSATRLPDDPIIVKAFELARQAHGEINHRRRYTHEPYLTHLVEVAQLVAQVTTDPEVIAAALLHDTLEDTHIDYTSIVHACGPRVAELVLSLTDVSHPDMGKRSVRKEADRQHLAKATPEAKTIKLADLISNSDSIVKHDPKFWLVYRQEKLALLNVLLEGDATLLKLAHSIVCARPY